MSQPEDSALSSAKLNRRRVLRLAGGAAVTGGAVGAATGVGLAHQAGEIRFCGCSQVCACEPEDVNQNGDAYVILAEETDEGFEFSVVHRTFPFCYEVSSGKIIALAVPEAPDDDGYDFHCNPNTCAQKALDEFVDDPCSINLPSSHDGVTWDCGEFDDCNDTDDKRVSIETGQCGHPPCEHPGNQPERGNGQGH